MRLDDGMCVVIVGGICLSVLYFWSALRGEKRRLAESVTGALAEFELRANFNLVQLGPSASHALDLWVVIGGG